jgi:hypothetical protein
VVAEGFTVTDVPVTAPTPAFMARVVAPVTDQLSVADWPVMSFAGAVNVAMVGRGAVAAAAGDTPAKRRNASIVKGMVVQLAYRPTSDNLAITLNFGGDGDAA